jgi:trk system potassium uptake protein TrkA
MARKGEFLVVGLGRFGSALALQLVELGREVLGIDADAKTVQDHAERLTHVAQADATDEQAMREVGAQDFETAVIAIGNHLEASVLATAVLVDLGVPRIVAKAITAPHGKILERVGAHRVVFPEGDKGREEALRLAGRDVIDTMQLEGGFLIVETMAPAELVGKTLAESHIRKRFGITIVAVKHRGETATYATPDTVVSDGDILVVAGENRVVEEFVQLR